MDVLKGSIGWAMDTSVKPSEIYEVLLQGYLFLGYPVAIESFFILDEVLGSKSAAVSSQFDKAPAWDYNDFKSKGKKTAEKIYADMFDPVFNNIWRLSPDLASGMVIEGYGRIISRPGLDIIERELAVVSALTVTDMPRQLHSHIKGSINAGAGGVQIQAAIRQCRYFAESPVIDKALTIFEKLLGKIIYPK
jgi:4-carboxymuconolactone decarboxylase